MKTITEFSGILLQRAAEAQRAFQAEHPRVAPIGPEATAPSTTDGDVGVGAPEADSHGNAVEAGASLVPGDETSAEGSVSAEGSASAEGECWLTASRRPRAACRLRAVWWRRAVRPPRLLRRRPRLLPS